MPSRFYAYCELFTPCKDCWHESHDAAVTCALAKLTPLFDAIAYGDSVITCQRSGAEDAIYEIVEFPFPTLEEEVETLERILREP
jgi:hypothetical protein